MQTNPVDTLNELLRGEISAVETYRQALEKLSNSPARAQLEDCRRSHEMRVQKLREQVVRMGGNPDDDVRRLGRVRQAVRGRRQGVRRKGRHRRAGRGRGPRAAPVQGRHRQAGSRVAGAGRAGRAARAGANPPLAEHAEARDALSARGIYVSSVNPNVVAGLPGWPARLWLARHGQSAGNVAAAEAAAAGAGPDRRRRSRRRRAAVARWADGRRTRWATGSRRSPPASARRWCWCRLTCARRADRGDDRDGRGPGPRVRSFRRRRAPARAGAGHAEPTDQSRHHGALPEPRPSCAPRLGKFYYRPPVAARAGATCCCACARSSITCASHCGGERVLIVAPPGDRALLPLSAGADDRGADPAHRRGGRGGELRAHRLRPRAEGDRMLLRFYNFVAPLEQAGAPVTEETDAPAAAR